MDVPKYIQIAFILVVVISVVMFIKNGQERQEKQLEIESHPSNGSSSPPNADDNQTPQVVSGTDEGEESLLQVTEDSKLNLSSRKISTLESAVLPIKNIVASTQVKHSIPIDEIR